MYSGNKREAMIYVNRDEIRSAWRPDCRHGRCPSARRGQGVLARADRGLSNLKGFEDPVRTWEVLW